MEPVPREALIDIQQERGLVLHSSIDNMEDIGASSGLHPEMCSEAGPHFGINLLECKV